MNRIRFIVEIDESHREVFLEIISKSRLPVNVTMLSDDESGGCFTENLEIQQYLSDFLINLGIPASLRGYDYIKAAILYVIYDPTYLRRKITSRLYPAIANKFGTKATSVEKAIRHAVAVSWDRGDRSYLNRLFGSSILEMAGKLTNSEYIARIVEVVKAEALCQKAEMDLLG